MTELGIERPIVGLIHTILTSRVVYSTMGSAQSTRNVSRGTPQGEEAGTKVVAYADEVVILMQGKFPQTLCNLMETALSSLSSNQAKYLGVILDKKLLWAENIADRTRKAAIALFACKKAIGRKWGFSPVIVHWLYTAIVRPILLYGIIVWWHSLEKYCNLKNLNKIQRSAELCISGALRTTATEALNTILDLEPLDLLAKSWASATALRLREASAWSTGSSGHSRILTNQRYIPHIPTRSEWDHLPHQIENAVNIYTDGSKLNLQTGGGVFSPELDIKVSFRLPDHCSVFQAEVMAIQEAMSYLDTTKHCNTDIFIFSDSQAALRALDSYSTNSLTISECRKSLNEMATHLRISLIWVPGHRNIEGNCIADELARQGTTTDILRDKDTVGMPIATCKLLLKQRLYTLSNNRWNTIPTCHTSRLTWGTHARRLGLSSYNYCRSCKQIEEEENIEHLLCFCPAHNLKRFQTLGRYTLPNLAAIQVTSIPKLLCFLKRTNWFEKPNNP
ncbi:uncharacterized protein [Drosophila takahashii]|uniref:uncharacterized protein n=1 Tax=Drosophila takahashii TaxID=29030 RepID=UPI001CF808F7|nr:uncharacterized protein LOC123002513 [Drosophila takahashii]